MIAVTKVDYKVESAMIATQYCRTQETAKGQGQKQPISKHKIVQHFEKEDS